MKIYAEAAFSWVGRQQLFERADESKVCGDVSSSNSVLVKPIVIFTICMDYN